MGINLEQKTGQKNCRIDPLEPDGGMIARAAQVICNGGTVIFPTRGLYGLGADASNRAAVDRVWRIKHRAAGKPILVLIADVKQLDRLVTDISPGARRLMYRFWPGGLTLLFTARPGLPGALVSGSGKIGIRLTAYPAARALITACDRPITATSANFSGQPGCWQPSKMPLAFVEQVDLWLDAGDLQGGIPSTVVDVTGSAVSVVRHGIIAPEQVTQTMQLKS